MYAAINAISTGSYKESTSLIFYHFGTTETRAFIQPM